MKQSAKSVNILVQVVLTPGQKDFLERENRKFQKHILKFRSNLNGIISLYLRKIIEIEQEKEWDGQTTADRHLRNRE